MKKFTYGTNSRVGSSNSNSAVNEWSSDSIVTDYSFLVTVIVEPGVEGQTPCLIMFPKTLKNS